MNTRMGLSKGEGIGLTMKGRWMSLGSLQLPFFRLTDDFRFFRSEDLKDPCKWEQMNTQK